MYEFYNAFENYDYDELCGKLQDRRKGEDESTKGLLSIFVCICHRFPLVDKPSHIEIF